MANFPPISEAKLNNLANYFTGRNWYANDYTGGGTGSFLFAPYTNGGICGMSWHTFDWQPYGQITADPDGAGGMNWSCADNITIQSLQINLGAFLVDVAADLQVGGNLSLTGTMTSGTVPTTRLSGTLQAAQFPALTGDVTTVAGALAATIANDAVTNAKAANMAANTIKGRITASTGDPEDLSAAQVRTILGLATIATSGSATDLASGTVPSARLGTGGGDDTAFLLGNQTFASIINYLRYNAYFFTEFMAGSAAIPELTYATAAGATSNSTAISGGIGVINFTTDNVTAASAGSALAVAAVRFSLYALRLSIRVQLSQLKAATDDIAFRIGFIDTTAAKPVDGAYVEYDSSASANWRICTANNSTRTETPTGTAVTATTWHLIEIVMNAAGTSVEFFLNGASLGTITTNIPTGAIRTTFFGFHVVRLAGTPSQNYSLSADLLGLLVDFASPR